MASALRPTLENLCNPADDRPDHISSACILLQRQPSRTRLPATLALASSRPGACCWPCPDVGEDHILALNAVNILVPQIRNNVYHLAYHTIYPTVYKVEPQQTTIQSVAEIFRKLSLQLQNKTSEICIQNYFSLLAKHLQTFAKLLKHF